MLKKSFIISSRTRIFLILFCNTVLLFLLASCGYKADPMVPHRNIPQRITKADIIFLKDTVHIRLFIPDTNEKGEKKDNLAGLEIYRKVSEIMQEKQDKEQEEKDTSGTIKRDTTAEEKSQAKDKSSFLSQKSEKTQTQESFGFGREMAMPGSNITSLGAVYDYQPVDFNDNYELIETLKLADIDKSTLVFADNISTLLQENVEKPLELSYVTRVIDSNNTRSKFSTIFYQRVFFSPEPPAFLECTGTENGIELSWHESKTIINNRDFSGQIFYDVFGSDSEDAIKDPFQKPLNPDPVKDLRYLDRTPRIKAEFYYTVRSVLVTQTGKYASAISKICKAEISLEKGIEIVEGLLAFTEENSIILLWKPSAQKNISGYNIYRKRKNQAGFTLITEKPVTSYRFHDTGLDRGVYQYYVTAVISTEPLIQGKPSAIAEAEIM